MKRIFLSLLVLCLVLAFGVLPVRAQTANLTTTGVTYNSDSSANISRTSDKVQAPSNPISPTQGWVAVRMKMGFPFNTTLSPDPIIWDMSESNARDLFVYYDVSSDTFHFPRNSGAGGVNLVSPVQNFASGNIMTVIAAWTASTVKISINGAAFTSSSSSSIPAAAPFLIGSSNIQGNGRQPNSDYYWVAAGTGTLTDANAATIHGFGNTDRTRSSFPGNAVFVWWANSDAYNNDGGATPPPSASPTSTNCVLNADSNNDGQINLTDFLALIVRIPSLVTGRANGDFNCDGKANTFDFGVWRDFFVPTSPTPPPANSPTATPRPGNSPTPQPTIPPVSGNFPCGKFPNANPGCMNVSFQSWFDNVPVSSQTLNVSYTPRLLHQHYECAVPQVRTNGQYLRQGMPVVCQLIRYNSIVPYLSSNSGSYDTCDQGNCYERYTLNLPACQTSKYLGRECRSENVHNIPQSVMNNSTEVRMRPNANFVGMDGGRHFISSNWQTGTSYRGDSEFTTRYWFAQCGTYQRVILKNVDRFFTGNEPIPTVRGTVSIPVITNGGCGSQFKTLIFLDPTQHVTNFGAQGGTTLMETNGHFDGNFSWNTTQTTNGIHSVLFINMEGTSNYVSAAGISLKFNVQN